MIKNIEHCAEKMVERVWCAAIVAIILLLAAVPVHAQGDDLPPLDESQFKDEESQYGDFEYDAGGQRGIPTAVIEGVQLSVEPGERPQEKVISGYFIFRDKPSSYFYEVKVKEKKIIFEFNDTRTSDAPVPSVAEPPIKSFTVEDRKININKDIKGLKPEYHNQIKVVFDVEDVPRIHVSDEFNIISFTYKWTTDSTKLKEYIIKPPVKWPWWAGGGTLLGVGGGIAYLLTRPPRPEELKDLEIVDLPTHIRHQ